MRPQTLSELQLDALREIGSIGAGHAATALSQLIDRPVGLLTPTIDVIDISDVPYVFGGPSQVVCAVYTRLLGDIGGGILFLATELAALSLIDLIRGYETGSTHQIDVDEEEVLAHTTAVLTSAYLAAISRMTNLNMVAAAPVLAVDMAGAILAAVATEVDMRDGQAVLVSTGFPDENNIVDAAIFFLPDPDSLLTILGRLGMA